MPSSIQLVELNGSTLTFKKGDRVGLIEDPSKFGTVTYYYEGNEDYCCEYCWNPAECDVLWDTGEVEEFVSASRLKHI